MDPETWAIIAANVPVVAGAVRWAMNGINRRQEEMRQELAGLRRDVQGEIKDIHVQLNGHGERLARMESK